MEKFFDSKSWQKFLSGKQDTHIWGEDFWDYTFDGCVFDSSVRFEQCKFRNARFKGVVFSGSEVFYECELRKGFGKAISSMKLRGFQPGQVFTRNQKGITLAQAIPRNRHFLQNKGLQADFINKAPGVFGLLETCSVFTFIASQEGRDFLLSDSGKEFCIPFSADHISLKEFLEYYSPTSEPE